MHINRKDAVALIVMSVSALFLVIYVVSAIMFANTKENYTYLCVTHGYPDVIATDKGYFCLKYENGTSIITPVESLAPYK